MITPDYDLREKLVDSLVASPQIRTDKVWKILRPYSGEGKLTNWDIISFCVSYLAAQVAMFDWLREPLLRLNQLHYTAHYYATEELGLYGLNSEGEVIKEDEILKKLGIDKG